MNDLNKIVRKWKERNDKGLCAICGEPLPRTVIDASYQITEIARDVKRVINRLEQLDKDLQEWFLNHGVTVCVKHMRG